MLTTPGKSLFYFGIYVVLTGLILILMPETFLSLTQLPALPLGWARSVGLLALVIGCYDLLSGRANIQPFIKISIPVRIVFAIGTILLFGFGQMPISILLLGGIDALGALWTFMCLKSEANKN